MIIDLRQFDDYPAHAVLEALPGEVEPFDDLVLAVGKVEVSLSLQKTGDEYFCQGTLRADVSLQCSRCAKEHPESLEGTMDFIIRAEGAPSEDGPEVIDDEDYVYMQGNNETADLSDLVRQSLLLAMPMKPLCSEDCRGLCPVCGTNLNDSTCTCVRGVTDPRWDGLRNLLGQ